MRRFPPPGVFFLRPRKKIKKCVFSVNFQRATKRTNKKNGCFPSTFTRPRNKNKTKKGALQASDPDEGWCSPHYISKRRWLRGSRSPETHQTSEKKRAEARWPFENVVFRSLPSENFGFFPLCSEKKL